MKPHAVHKRIKPHPRRQLTRLLFSITISLGNKLPPKSSIRVAIYIYIYKFIFVSRSHHSSKQNSPVSRVLNVNVKIKNVLGKHTHTRIISSKFEFIRRQRSAAFLPSVQLEVLERYRERERERLCGDMKRISKRVCFLSSLSTA